MKQGIYIKQAVDILPEYSGEGRCVGLALAPIGIVPTTFVATKTAEGGLADDTYYYKVTAIGINGESLGSSEANATTSGGDNSVTLEWDDQDDVTFRVYRGLATGVYTEYRETTSNTLLDDDDDKWLVGSSIPTVAPDITTYSWSVLNNVVGVEGVFVPAGNDGVSTTPKRTVIEISYNGGSDKTMVNLQSVLNQSSWNTGEQSCISQAISDIMSW